MSQDHGNQESEFITSFIENRMKVRLMSLLHAQVQMQKRAEWLTINNLDAESDGLLNFMDGYLKLDEDLNASLVSSVSAVLKTVKGPKIPDFIHDEELSWADNQAKNERRLISWNLLCALRSSDTDPELKRQLIRDNSKDIAAAASDGDLDFFMQLAGSSYDANKISTGIPEPTSPREFIRFHFASNFYWLMEPACIERSFPEITRPTISKLSSEDQLVFHPDKPIIDYSADKKTFKFRADWKGVRPKPSWMTPFQID